MGREVPRHRSTTGYRLKVIFRGFPVSINQFKNLPGNKLTNERHTAIVFGGFKPSVGTVGRVTQSTGPDQLLQKLDTLPLRLRDFHGSMSDENVYERSFEYIRRNFSEKGKLIIYGYSMGGTNAINLCNFIRNNHMYFQNGKFGGYRSGVGGEYNFEVAIDLLITIDAYDGKRAKAGRGIPQNVFRNINIYQTYSQEVTGSRGDRNWKRHQNTIICNQDRTSWAKYKKEGSNSHAIIDEDTNDLVFQKINHVIKGSDLSSICNLRSK